MSDLRILSHRRIERLVIRDLGHNVIDDLTELLPQLLARRVGILDGVVKQRGSKDVSILNLADIGDEAGNFDAVSDVRALARSLPALISVLVRRELCSLES